MATKQLMPVKPAKLSRDELGAIIRRSNQRIKIRSIPKLREYAMQLELDRDALLGAVLQFIEMTKPEPR